MRYGRAGLVALAGLILTLAAVPLDAGASRLRVERLKRISSDTPFRGGCPGVTGEPTIASEGEPHLAVAPGHPRRVAAVWQQDRFPIYGGARSNIVSLSSDSGRHWKRRLVPGISRCTGGADERVSDPWLSFGPDGELYLASLTFNNDLSGQVSEVTGVELAGATALEVSRSDDGGRHWKPPVSVVDAGLYDDREALTADPTRPGSAYMAWVRRVGAFGETGIEYFSRTEDAGRHWTVPRGIYQPPPGYFTDPTYVDVLPDGSLLNIFLLDNATFALPGGVVPVIPWTVMAMTSTDRGDTWAAPVEIATVQPYPPSDPDTGTEVRAIPLIRTAVARDGTVYVVWNEKPGAEVFDTSFVRIARSRDGGRTWSAPRLVARVSGQTFLPSVAVMRDGTVGVTWDDTRRDRRGDRRFTADVWFSHSHDGGRSWREQHVAGRFDLLTGPRSGSAGIGGVFLGDYQALEPVAGGFGAIFAASRPLARGGPSDVFFVRISRPVQRGSRTHRPR
jgi:hypothetical protein